MPYKILIAGKQIPISYGLEALVRSVLGGETIVDFADRYGDIIRKVEEMDYDMLISDVIMEGTDSFTMIEETLKRAPNIKILIVSSMSPGTIFSQRYLKVGAYGYIRTIDSEEEFRNAVRKVCLGKKYWPNSIEQPMAEVSANNKSVESPFSGLSKREFSVMLLLLEGKGVKEISGMLGLKISTISTFRIRIFKKLAVNNLLELATLARNFKLIRANIFGNGLNYGYTPRCLAGR